MDDERRRLPDPQPNWALFLDIDGTLLDIAARPDAVIVPDGVVSLLAGLNRSLHGAVALVSGRAIERIDAFFAPLILSAAGQHGAELRVGHGAIETFGTPNGGAATLLPSIQAFASTRTGILVEYKGATIAVHYRSAPQYGAELGTFLEEIIAGQSALLEIMRGHLVFDIKPRGIGKGTAVDRFMRTPSFAGRIPVFLGDDRTDEDGFAAAKRLGGFGVKVGGQGPTAAAWWLENPKEVRSWLAGFVQALNRNDGIPCKISI
jgi:trehalose 6-phosphate phosphatase